jgi:hypothetical protein
VQKSVFTAGPFHPGQHSGSPRRVTLPGGPGSVGRRTSLQAKCTRDSQHGNTKSVKKHLDSPDSPTQTPPPLPHVLLCCFAALSFAFKSPSCPRTLEKFQRRRSNRATWRMLSVCRKRVEEFIESRDTWDSRDTPSLQTPPNPPKSNNGDPPVPGQAAVATRHRSQVSKQRRVDLSIAPERRRPLGLPDPLPRELRVLRVQLDSHAMSAEFTGHGHGRTAP